MLEIISINDSERWDSIVKSFKDYDVYYLSGYVKALELHGDGQPLLFYFEDNNTRAINVVMKRDVSENKYFIDKIEKDRYYDLSTPYGYGGWLIEGEYTNKLNKEYSEYCWINNIVSEFVRVNPYITNVKLLSNMYNIRKIGKVVSVDTSSKDIIWSNIKSKDRNMINKSKNSDVDIFFDMSKELIDEFKKMYNETMMRNNAEKYYFFDKNFFEILSTGLTDNIMFVFAKKDESIVAMAVVIYSKKTLHYYLAASERKYQIYAPSNLMIYEIACWGCENGYTRFLLGGGVGGKEDNLYRFKKAFNKNGDKDFYIGGKIFNQQKYDELLDIRKKYNDGFDSSSQYIPLYRA